MTANFEQLHVEITDMDAFFPLLNPLFTKIHIDPNEN